MSRQQVYTFNIQGAPIVGPMASAGLGGCASMGLVTAAAAAPGMRSDTVQAGVFHQQGPLPPNTYVVSTAGPKIKATMGGCFNNLQAIGSPLQNTSGAFAPCNFALQFPGSQCY